MPYSLTQLSFNPKMHTVPPGFNPRQSMPSGYMMPGNMYPVMPANNVVPKTAISGAVDPRKPIPSNPPIDFNSLILKATEEGFEKREKEQQAILQQEKE
jgi:hypothetical protein